jgi:hypothetical protein
MYNNNNNNICINTLHKGDSIFTNNNNNNNNNNNIRNEAVLQRDKEERNIRHTIKGWKGSWNGHNLHRTCLLKQQLLDDL